MKSCILPINIDVEIKTYQHAAFPLSAIKASIPDYDIWLCNKYVNCSYISRKPHIFENDMWSHKDGLTTTQKIRLHPRNYKDNGIDLIKLCKSMLESECYIEGTYNEYYIRGKHAYNKFNYNHDFLIFGFDDTKNAFMSAGYLEDGKYAVYDISYDSFSKSIIHNDVDMVELQFRHIRKGYLPQIDMAHIKREISECLKPQLMVAGKHLKETDAQWNEFADYVLETENGRLDLHLGRLYMELRKVMSIRLYKLYELKYINDRSLCDEYHEKVYLKGNIIHCLFIKYNLTHNDAYLSRIADIIKKIAEDERRLLAAVVQQLS